MSRSSSGSLEVRGPRNRQRAAKEIGYRRGPLRFVGRGSEQVLAFTTVLSRNFSSDPEALYVLIHAYSDLSSRAAQDLARTAPFSIPALELDAEANEMQGKWDQAEKDYRKILQQNPKYPGVHFQLARIQLSQPNPGPDFRDNARKELLEELEIDPSNAEAEYILGELARQTGDLAEAIERFSKATQPESCGAYRAYFT